MTINEIKAFALTNNLIISPRKRRAWKLYCECVYQWEFKLQTHGKTMRKFLQPQINGMFRIHEADSYDAAYIRAQRRFNKWPIEERRAHDAAAWERITKMHGIARRGN
jgi:hypothetical protein